MAILCKRVSISIEPTLRIKQRDYTIPVRLNQRLPPRSENQQQVKAGACTTGCQLRLKTKTPQRPAGPVDQHNQASSQFYRVNRMIHPMISMKATTRRFLPPVVLVLFACATLSINTEICHCDTKTILHRAAASSSSSSSPVASNYDSNNLNSHKENLLSALSDNIERQHFKIKPARALIQQRPSKFDSADYLSDLNLNAGIDFIKKKAQPLVSIKPKVDDSMRQILKMHEHAAAAAAAASASSSHHHHHHQGAGHSKGGKPSSPVAIMPPPPPMPEQSFAVKRWRKITSSPNLVSSLNDKVVSKALAYVTPLVGSKLADSTILGQSFAAKNSTSYTNRGSRIRLHPFVGRSSNQASLSKNLISFRPYHHSTTSPQTSSLSRPLGFGDRGDNRANQYSTPLSTFNKDNYKETSGLKTGSRSGSGGGGGAGNSVDSIINDLMADSSDSSIGATIEAASAGISSQSGGNSFDKASGNSGGGGGGGTVGDTKLADTNRGAMTTGGVTSQKQPHKSAGSRLKKGANQLAQNYFHNLITLSQLPILSTTSSMTSTAPSVLEKKRKPNKIDKIGVNSKFLRRRLIEDLYRYAYMLSTGVRNKRDPLEALGSSPNPSIISSSKGHKKGALSQRSINQLMASNHNQILNYIRKLRSMLTMGPLNKAKPRGVMWDMATDPSLAVTVFHLLERASVALPLGFLFLPMVRMIRHPLNGLNLGRILPAKASHRSVDIEELAKRLDIVDKMLSRALRSTHRESFIGK